MILLVAFSLRVKVKAKAGLSLQILLLDKLSLLDQEQMIPNLDHLVFVRRLATHLSIALILFHCILVVNRSYHGKFAITGRSLRSHEII